MNEYFHNSLEQDSAEMEQIKAAVREAGVFIVLGYSEKLKGTLYIAQVDRNSAPDFLSDTLIELVVVH